MVTPISLSAFQAFAGTLLTGDPDNPVAPEALADVFETMAVTFSTHAHSDEEVEGPTRLGR